MTSNYLLKQGGEISMKMWEMLKVFTEQDQPKNAKIRTLGKVKAKVLNIGIREDPSYPYDFISTVGGVFYWNNDFSKPFRINEFYNVLDIEWEII